MNYLVNTKYLWRIDGMECARFKSGKKLAEKNIHYYGACLFLFFLGGYHITFFKENFLLAPCWTPTLKKKAKRYFLHDK